MTEKYLQIDNFSPKEVTEMFDAICTEVMKKTPVEVKVSLLGIKAAKKDTKVTLSHLMTLIEANDLEFKFKVNYIDGDEKKPEKAIVPNFEVGLKIDPVQEAIKEQKIEVFSQDHLIEKEVAPTRNFEEVGATKGKVVEKSEDVASTVVVPPFDPSAIPDFKF